jgi:hypothetical protein
MISMVGWVTGQDLFLFIAPPANLSSGKDALPHAGSAAIRIDPVNPAAGKLASALLHNDFTAQGFFGC